MRKINLSGHEYSVAPALDGFTIIEVLDSKNVFCVGVSESTKQFYAKFLNGSEYIYNDVPVEVLRHTFTIDSMGGYVNKYLRGKYEFVKQELPFMMLATSTEVNSSPEPKPERAPGKRQIFFPEVVPFVAPVLKGSPSMGDEHLIKDSGQL